MQEDETPKRSQELSGDPCPETAVDPNRKPFRVTPIALTLPKEWTSGCMPELLEMLEGPDYR
jgi:hypothetical protein